MDRRKAIDIEMKEFAKKHPDLAKLTNSEKKER